MKSNLGLTFLAAALLASSTWSVAHASDQRPTPAAAGIDVTGTHGFDFLVGEWRVHHRRISAVTKKWVEFEGTCSLRLLMDGTANVEEHLLSSPDGVYRAVGLRSYDRQNDKWSIWWLDGRYPAGPLDPASQGKFENGVGSFYGTWEQDGKKMIGRLQWSAMTATSAHWEQANSADGGKTWETNWYMDFKRVE